MATDPDGGSHSITRSGFQFLLMETSSQVNLPTFMVLEKRKTKV